MGGCRRMTCRPWSSVGGRRPPRRRCAIGPGCRRVAGSSRCRGASSGPRRCVRRRPGCRRPRHRRLRGVPMVRRVACLRIPARLSPIPGLLRGRRNMARVHCRFFLRRRAPVHAARAIEAGVAVVLIADDCPIHVHVVDHGRVHVDDGRVVLEHVAAPPAADKSCSEVTESVAHAAVKSDLGAPVPGIPHVSAVRVAPVSRRPQQPRIGWRNPRSRYPVVPGVRAPRPVPGRPQPAIRGAGGLIVNGQHRGRCRHGNGDADLRGRGCWKSTQQQGGQKNAEFQESFHSELHRGWFTRAFARVRELRCRFLLCRVGGFLFYFPAGSPVTPGG